MHNIAANGSHIYARIISFVNFAKLAQSYLPMTSQTTGAAAEAVADRKTAKYAPLTQSYLFVPIAVETMGDINRVGKEFLSDLGRRITQMTNEKREGAFLFQHLSMVIQRYNTVAIQGTSALTSPEDEL